MYKKLWFKSSDEAVNAKADCKNERKAKEKAEKAVEKLRARVEELRKDK